MLEKSNSAWGRGTVRIEANLEQKLFMLAIIFLPLTNFRIELPVGGGEVSRLFLFLGGCIYLYKIYTKQVTLDRFEKLALYYLAVSLLWQIICTVIGVLEYDYYDIIYLEQMDKLCYLLYNLKQTGIHVEEMAAIKTWLLLRFIKDCVLYVFFSYGASLWIYHLYKEYKTDTEKQNALVSHVTAAVSVLCLLLITYSVVETGYLQGSKFCADILSATNPLLYEIGSVHGGWPPVLLPGRLRSLCAEPSFFGIISVIILFVLFYKNLTTNRVFYGCLLSAFVMMTVMSRSRAAISLYIVQGTLLLCYAFGLNRQCIKGAIKIIAITALSVLAGVYLVSEFKPVAKVAAKSSKQTVKAVTNTAKPAAKDKANTAKPNAKGKVDAVKPTAKDKVNTAKPNAKGKTDAVKPAAKGKPNNANVTIQAATDDLLKRSVPFADKASAGSDMSRLNSTKAYFLTGLQHPVFGVGRGFSNAYADANYFPEDVWRVNIWSSFIRQKGVLRSPVPVLNHWSNEMAQFGIVGLILFLLPVYYIAHTLRKLFPKGITVAIACAAITYFGSNVALLSYSALSSYYFMTGIVLVLLQGKTERRV